MLLILILVCVDHHECTTIALVQKDFILNWLTTTKGSSKERKISKLMLYFLISS
jgi:hypothetical protein